MKIVEIIPNKLSGDILIPPSKSLSHRAIISAGLSDGESIVSNLIFSDDIEATLNAMKVFGVKDIVISEDNIGRYSVRLKCGNKGLKEKVIDCKESGSTLRFLIPLSALQNREIKLIGRGKLVSRPLEDYYRIFDKQGIKYSNNNGQLPLIIDGLLKSDEFDLSGNVSSQFITGLMLALPLLDGDSKINITTELESIGYVDLTLDMLNRSGIIIENKGYKQFIIKGNQNYKPIKYNVEGDFSQAAFWIIAGLIGESITCKGLNIESLQGDKTILDIVKAMGANIQEAEDKIIIKPSKTKGTDIDVSQCPDLAPVLTALAAVSKGTTRILNAERLRIKESDRLKAICTELNKLGGDVTEYEDSLIINGKLNLKGGKVDSWNDHRIAMALAVASIKCTEKVTIANAEAVNKSYPSFWEDFKLLGGNINEWNVG
ncbi:3-phosphoshikimate 1-carboxyvinyltransferase [Abyssisolibacter fermentans]|uniref:3-phosphoshikimate 1-carboxyvinyltransferase n=1 Tax=Abyssisolibacter fermentans TaxID=1766203 RepID=UPI000835ED37|nr:3-phosphoshikimate 1-carboxyvinyltransferase [Abyssisolibacter fermentans]